MNTSKVFSISIIFVLLVGVVVAESQASGLIAPDPVGTGFTYQGRLTDTGGPVSGSCDFDFSLYDALSDGTLVAGPLAFDDLIVTDGYFTAQLDFGSDVFQGDARWLEVSVDCGGGATTLSPRQALTPTPYALSAPGLE